MSPKGSGVIDRRDLPLLLAFLGLFTAAGPACKDSPPKPPPGPTTRLTPVARPAVTHGDAKLAGFLTELPKRGQCALLRGCPVAEELVRVGRPAVEPLIRLYERTSGDKHWRKTLLRVLGRIGDPGAVPFLLERLQDPKERLPADAALALGHLRAEEARAPLETLRAAAAERGDVALQLTTAYALTRIGAEEYRSAAVSGLASETRARLDAGRLLVAMEVVRWLDAREHEDAVVALLDHESLFVRRNAVLLARDWRLRAAVPKLIARVEDTSASVREAAIEALQRLSGKRYKRTRAQWDAWCHTKNWCHPAPKTPPAP